MFPDGGFRGDETNPEEPLVLESSALGSYDLVLLDYNNWQRPSITEKARENLLAFVMGGKGLVVYHFSVRAFEDWPEYRNLVGRIWTTGSGHGPRGPFKVKIVDKDHPITQGTNDFEADDELYAKLVGDAPIQPQPSRAGTVTGQSSASGASSGYHGGRRVT